MYIFISHKRCVFIFCAFDFIPLNIWKCQWKVKWKHTHTHARTQLRSPRPCNRTESARKHWFISALDELGENLLFLLSEKDFETRNHFMDHVLCTQILSVCSKLQLRWCWWWWWCHCSFASLPILIELLPLVNVVLCLCCGCSYTSFGWCIVRSSACYEKLNLEHIYIYTHAIESTEYRVLYVM